MTWDTPIIIPELPLAEEARWVGDKLQVLQVSKGKNILHFPQVSAQKEERCSLLKMR